MARELPNDIGQLLEFVSRIYDYRITECGPEAKGVFWKDADGQILRLEILLKAITAQDLNGPVTINDLGCGYGALFELIRDEPVMDGGTYSGYDISPKMIREATTRHTDPRARFVLSPVATHHADYGFVSGTYNMSVGADRAYWERYIKNSVEVLWSKTGKVLAYNLLDEQTETKLDDLYYANKRTFIEHALTLTPEVEVIDDYPLSEFTLFLKRTT